MSRYNPIIERIFSTIVDENPNRGTIQSFLNIEDNLNLPKTQMVENFKEMYHNVINGCMEDLYLLSKLEEIIIQTRCKSIIQSEMKLSLSRNYIYARSTFYRKGKEMNDIRVMVGKTDNWGDDLNALMANKQFRILCHTMLIDTMDREIESNVKQLNKKFLCQD